MEAKKFKRKLPNQYVYIFTDLKDANEFYYYISTKFPPNQEGDSEENVPAQINNTDYYVSFYETEKKSKFVSLMPFVEQAVFNSDADETALFDEVVIIPREGTWYIALIITDVDFNDALSPNYKDRDKILEYARSLYRIFKHTQLQQSLITKKVTYKNTFNASRFF